MRAQAARAVVCGAAWALLVAALAGCTGGLAFATPLPAEPEQSTPAPESTAPAPGGAPDAPRSDSRQLVIWLPAFSGIAGEDSAGDVLAGAFRQFEQTHPGVRVDVQIRAESGPSDLFAYLRSAQRVAPSILPDVVLINTQALWQIVDLGLATPIPADQANRADDFYPFAVDAVRYGGEIYGIPYAADAIHLAYQGDQTQQPPATWGQLFTNGQPYWFTAAGDDLFQNGAALLQYAAAGGQLLEDGSTSSDEALRAYFDFLVEGRIRNVIPTEVADLATLDAVWSRLVGPEPDLGNVAVSAYLLNRDTMPQLHFAQTPTRNGLPITLASTWAFVVLTPGEEQRSLAFELVDALLAPEVQGAWSQYSHRLPTRRSAMQAWANPTPYYEFLNRQLDVAVAPPNGRAFADFAHRMQSAQRGVVLGEISPQEAVQIVRGPE
jgi:ABC-type glycerol-3-phosphate transport system substrate-binding protein